MRSTQYFAPALMAGALAVVAAAPAHAADAVADFFKGKTVQVYRPNGRPEYKT